MRTLGPIYLGKLNYYHRKALPIVELGRTQETDFPYRSGRCLVFRVPFTKPGFYLGLLFKTVKDPHLLTDEDVDLLVGNALKARKVWSPEDGAYHETF
jgi:hypothetical protein